VQTALLAAPVKMKTSAINLDRTPGQHGFTLIELLVVLALGAMLIGLVPMAFNRLQEGSQYRDTVRALVTGLRQARQQAVTSRRTVIYQIDLTQRQFGLQGQPQRPLPSHLEVKTVVGELDTTPVEGMAFIAFLPEGGSTGGSVELARPSGGGIRIRVDWLLGQITQEPRSL